MTDGTEGMPRLIWVLAGCTGDFVGFVLLWLINGTEMQSLQCDSANYYVMGLILRHMHQTDFQIYPGSDLNDVKRKKILFLSVRTDMSDSVDPDQTAP